MKTPTPDARAIALSAAAGDRLRVNGRTYVVARAVSTRSYRVLDLEAEAPPWPPKWTREEFEAVALASGVNRPRFEPGRDPGPEPGSVFAQCRCVGPDPIPVLEKARPLAVITRYADNLMEIRSRGVDGAESVRVVPPKAPRPELLEGDGPIRSLIFLNRLEVL